MMPRPAWVLTHPLRAHKSTQTACMPGHELQRVGTGCHGGSVGEDSWEGDARLTIELGLAHANNDDRHGEFGSLGKTREGQRPM